MMIKAIVQKGTIMRLTAASGTGQLLVMMPEGKEQNAPSITAMGEMLEHFSYSYDDKGNQVVEQHITLRSKNKSGGKNTRTVEQTTDRALNYVKTWRYDDSGKVISEMDNVGGIPVPFETFYKYDAFDSVGNWLLREDIENGKIVSTTTRIIEYYN